MNDLVEFLGYITAQAIIYHLNTTEKKNHTSSSLLIQWKNKAQMKPLTLLKIKICAKQKLKC